MENTGRKRESPFHMAPGQFYAKQQVSPVDVKVGSKCMKQQSRNILDSLRLDQNFCGRRYKERYIDQHMATCDRMYSTSIYGHHGCVNALAFSQDGEKLLATGKENLGKRFWGTNLFFLIGGDDRRVLIWTVADAIQGQNNIKPVTMATQHDSNIFTIDFSCDNSFIFTGGNVDG